MVKNIKVWQLKNTSSNRNLLFSSLRFLKKMQMDVSIDNYKVVYQKEMSIDYNSVYNFLEELYVKFQGVKPETYKGHSLSVSDIISIDDDYYYCDSCGFVKL